jgi:hypothetical protein
MRLAVALLALVCVLVTAGRAAADQQPRYRLSFAASRDAPTCNRPDTFRAMLRTFLRRPLYDPAGARELSVRMSRTRTGEFGIDIWAVDEAGKEIDRDHMEIWLPDCFEALYDAAYAAATMIEPDPRLPPEPPPKPCATCPACSLRPREMPVPVHGPDSTSSPVLMDHGPLLPAPRFAFAVGVVGVFGSVPGFIAPGVMASIGARWRPLSVSAEVRGAWGLEGPPRAPSLRPWALALSVPVCGHWQEGPFACGVLQVEGVGTDYRRIDTRLGSAFGARGGIDLPIKGVPFRVRLWGEAVVRPSPRVLQVEGRTEGRTVDVYRGFLFGGTVGVAAAF